MFKQLLDHFKKIDWFLISIPVLLSVFGIIIQYSLVNYESEIFLNNFIKQIIFLFVGFIVMFFVSFYEYHSLLRQSNYFYIIILVSLLAVLIFGNLTHGARGWFDFGFFKLQPVEFLKIFLILILSIFWGNHNRKKVFFGDILKSFLFIIPSIILLLLQPDFGGALVIFLVSISYIFIINSTFKHYFILFFTGIFIVLFTWVVILKPYQKDRVLTFINPLSDPLGSGYQVSQSMIAVGSGGFFGKGFGFGAQSQLNFLPESTNDFVFAAMSEEFGFIGASIIYILYIIFFYRIYYVIKNLEDDVSIFVFYGFAVLFLIHVIINIGMNIGVMPVTGLSLPFVSYGGSGLIANFIILGIMQNIITSQKRF